MTITEKDASWIDLDDPVALLRDVREFVAESAKLGTELTEEEDTFIGGPAGGWVERRIAGVSATLLWSQGDVVFAVARDNSDFGQAYFSRPVSPLLEDSEPECGTACCVAGYVKLRAELQGRVMGARPSSLDFAGELLGLRPDAWWALFVSSNTAPEVLAMLDALIENRHLTASQLRAIAAEAVNG